MDKLTQFVSKSFDNNNSVACVDGDRSLKSSMIPSPENLVKNEDEAIIDQKNDEENDEEKAKPVAKNWLIPDSPKTSPTAYGIDLTLNSSFATDQGFAQNIRKSESSLKNSPRSPMMRWFEHNADMKTPSPKNGYVSSGSSPIDLEDSKSCPETLASDRINNEESQSAMVSQNKKSTVDTEKKMCESF